MVSNLYLLALLISLFDIVFLTYKKDRLIDRYMWSGIILIPIIILGYWLKTTVHTTEAAMIAFCFIYLDSTLLLVIALFTILRSIRINVSGWIKVGVYGITILHLLTIWLSKDNNLYYASMTLIPTENGTATKMTSGPLKVTHYIYLGSILISIITALMFGFFRKGTYSKKTLRVYSIFAILGLAVYIYELLVDVDFSSLPFIYAAASFVITFRYDHFLSHNIDTLIGEKESE